jgi:hypothetical protein
MDFALQVVALQLVTDVALQVVALESTHDLCNDVGCDAMLMTLWCMCELRGDVER